MTSRFIINHLWQSSCFVLLAGLLAFMLRRNSPKVRYWIWLSASLKFLAPFALLVSLGSVVTRPARHAIAVAAPVFPITLVQIAEPFSPAYYATVPAHAQVDWVLAAMGILWALGFLAVVLVRYRSWVRIRAALRASTPVDLPIPVPAFIAPGTEEPGVVGFLRPVLVLPAHFLEHLNPRQLDAVLTHELCHVRRRDNLFAAVHMIVEAVFWFHPLVWWIGSRLVEERELACDEEVLRMGCEATDYVEGMLKVCRFYTESPLPCVSGVTGAHVKTRLRAILAGNIARELNTGRKLLLATAGMLVVAGPIAIGIMNPPLIRAQAQPADAVAFEVASVKPMPPVKLMPGDRPFAGPELLPSGRFVFRYVLQFLITFAYNLPLNPGDRLSGAPEWTRSVEGLYDIEATGEFPAGLSDKARTDRARLMVQALLADRFKLKIHRETKEIPVYVLTVAKGGPKLQKADIEEKDCPVPDRSAVPPQDPRTFCHWPNGAPGIGIHARALSISELVRFLENFTLRPLLDKTGIEGLYHIETTGWQRMDLGPPAAGEKTEDGRDLADVPTLFTVLGELGLKMESTKDKSEVYVIDHIERPTEN